MNCIELIMGAQFILTALGFVGRMPPLSELLWVYRLLDASGVVAAAPLCLYGSGLACMGVSGTCALVVGEEASCHGSLMFGFFHWSIALVCTHFRQLPGLFPGGLIFHALVGTLFLASFPGLNKRKTS